MVIVEGYSRVVVVLLLLVLLPVLMFKLADEDLFLLMRFERMEGGRAGLGLEARPAAAVPAVLGWTWTAGVDERVSPLLLDGLLLLLLFSCCCLVL